MTPGLRSKKKNNLENFFGGRNKTALPCIIQVTGDKRDAAQD